MSIPFIDLMSQFARLEGEIRKGIDRVLSDGQFILGQDVAELEKELASFIGVKHAITCSSGTDALLMALMAKGIGPGDAVFTSPFTFIATAEVIALVGATPVFVDIDEATFNIDPDKLKEAVNNTKKDGKLRAAAIIPVDLFGLPADYVRIEKIADENALFLLEDACQGFGGEWNGKRAGSFGDVGATSFFPAKPLGCYGDGGAVFTDDDSLSLLISSIREHGQGVDKYNNVRVGINGRFDTLQAAILRPKLEIFPEELEAREKIANRYKEKLGDAVVTPTVPAGFKSSWAQYTIRSEKRDQIKAALSHERIPSAIYYPKPLHLQEAFIHLGYSAGDFPLSEKISTQVLSLPMSPYLTDKDMDQVVSVVRQTASG